jgi:hypothetical protein
MSARQKALIASLLLLQVITPTSWAAPAAGPTDNPAAVANNPVGVNLVRWWEPHFVNAAAELVNSGGGDWGYVTVVLVDDDRNYPERFQAFLDQCAKLHITPVIRVGTTFDLDAELWKRPEWRDAELWYRYFERMRWPTALRHLVVGNEPNLGREWGGAVDGPMYARYLAWWIEVFGDRPYYRMYNGALDASNDTGMPDRQDMFEFIADMKKGVPDIFDRLHGWASNPYHFWWQSRELRYTFRSYEVELEAIGRDLPVLIVESALAHIDDPRQIADYYQMAFEWWLNDKRVLAATPLFWNPEENSFWLFDVGRDGTLRSAAPAYHRIKFIDKPAGSSIFGAPPELLAALNPAPKPVEAPIAVPATRPPGGDIPSSAFAHRAGELATPPPSMRSRSRQGENPDELPVLAR